MRRPVRGLTLSMLAIALAAAGYGQNRETDEQLIRKLIQTLADARNAGDGAAVARLYSDTGEWIGARGRPRFTGAALVTLWTGLPGKVQRSVQSIEFVSELIAVARVATQYAEPIGRRNEVYVLVKEPIGWRIRVHHTVD